MDNPRNPGLIGRDDVLAQLVRAVEELAGGRGGLVLLTGEAGIGKSAVVAAAAATAQSRGARVVWGWGWPGEGMPAYWPWVQVFRSLVAAGGGPPGLAAGASSLARLLPELPGTADGPAAGDELTAAARFRLLDELATILLAAATERPLVVVLEDLQWADAPSLQLLDFLARRLPASRVLVLGTWRDLEQPKSDPLVPLLAGLVPRSTVVALGPLAGAETARLVAAILGGEPDPALVAGIRRRAGGNPFFVQQVTRLLLTQPGEPAGIPVGVREVVERRLARLRPACATLVTTAAVAGPEFGAALLARVTGEPAAAVRDLLDEAAGAHILDGPQRPLRPYRFVHDLFRESILAGLDPPALARLHLRVACALEEERDAGEPVAAAQLADHFAKGGPGAGAAAVRYAVLAAAEATRRLAHDEAARHLARALEVLDEPAHGDRRTELLLGLASARRRAGDLAGSWQACLQAAELARRRADPRALARAALGLHAVGTRSWPSPVQQLVPVLEEAAAALGDQDPPLRARVLASLARELAWNGTDLAQASRLADEAMAAARGTGDRATLGACLVARHNAGWGPHNAADRLALAGRVAELAGREDPELLAEARLLAATDRLELADPRFQRELAEFLRVAADLGQPRLRYAALARRAAQGLLAGRWHDPERAARAALERDALVAELTAATGLGGRARRLGDQSERARKTVTARIRDVIHRVERVHPALGAHLRASVTTGTFCSYSPPAPADWEL